MMNYLLGPPNSSQSSVLYGPAFAFRRHTCPLAVSSIIVTASPDFPYSVEGILPVCIWYRPIATAGLSLVRALVRTGRNHIAENVTAAPTKNASASLKELPALVSVLSRFASRLVFLLSANQFGFWDGENMAHGVLKRSEGFSDSIGLDAGTMKPYHRLIETESSSFIT